MHRYFMAELTNLAYRTKCIWKLRDGFGGRPRTEAVKGIGAAMTHRQSRQGRAVGIRGGRSDFRLATAYRKQTGQRYVENEQRARLRDGCGSLIASRA